MMPIKQCIKCAAQHGLSYSRTRLLPRSATLSTLKQGTDVCLMKSTTDRLFEVSLNKSSCLAAQMYSTGPPKNLSESTESFILDVTPASPATIPERGPLPIITSRKLTYPPLFKKPRICWVENIDTIETEKLGTIDLHPEVWGEFPRVDLLHVNAHWQRNWKFIDKRWFPNRAERRGGGQKPWPQKGLGKARQGSSRATQWLGGGASHQPRGPRTRFYVPDFAVRLLGLTSALSARFAQDCVYVVDNFSIPQDEPQYLDDLATTRKWGISVLYVDSTDIMPRNIALATERLPGHTLMPVYGLNVHSILKHDALVLTLAAVDKLEERIMNAKNQMFSGKQWYHPEFYGVANGRFVHMGR